MCSFFHSGIPTAVAVAEPTVNKGRQKGTLTNESKKPFPIGATVFFPPLIHKFLRGGKLFVRRYFFAVIYQRVSV